MFLKCIRFAFAIPTFLVMSSTVLATGMDQEARTAATYGDNAEERINYSGKLRMLSQRIPSAACHLSRGIDVDGSSKLLTAAPVEFEKILNALEFGDAELNIHAPEKRRKTLMRIHTLRAAWEPMKAAAGRISDGTGTEEDVNLVLTQNMAVLGAAVQLVPELVKQYSNPNAVPYADLLLIDISGRQRMLTQKMSKESCILGTDHQTADTRPDLEKTMRIFEASLEALRHGKPELGLKAPPNHEISDGLDVVHYDWHNVKPLLDTVLAGQSLEGATDKAKFQRLNTTMSNMNDVVGLYTRAAKPQAFAENL